MTDKRATGWTWKITKLPAVLIAALLIPTLIVVVLEIKNGRLPKAARFQHIDQPAKVALIIQGRSSSYEAWNRLYQNMDSMSAVDLYYGSYDASVRNCSATAPRAPRGALRSRGVRRCLFLPNSTWASGRNSLARAVYRQHQGRPDTVYKYWLFVDEDALQLRCAACEVLENVHSCCWDTFIEYLLMASVQHASVGLTDTSIQPKFRTQSGELYFGSPFAQLFHDCIDAQIHALHAQAVPLFLPYFIDLEAHSWWESQALQFYLAAGCVPGATIVLGGFGYSNAEHKGYPSGRVAVATEEAVLKERIPELYDMLPHVVKDPSSSTTTGFQQGNCAGLGVEGWQDVEYVYGNQPDSSWWRKSQRYKTCMTTLKRRFTEFMEAPMP